MVVNADQRNRAEQIREGLRALIAENNAEPVSSPRPDGLNPAARARVPVEEALARLLVVVAEAVAKGTPDVRR